MKEFSQKSEEVTGVKRNLTVEQKKELLAEAQEADKRLER